nr:MAG TPA: hypothetical protein [Caudoviricetes sp.]
MNYSLHRYSERKPPLLLSNKAVIIKKKRYSIKNLINQSEKTKTP